jgi:alpha-glucosidase
MRAMILEYPDDAESLRAESQFMLGKELLVAPVVEKGAESKRVYLPQGEWIFFGDGVSKYTGSQWLDFPVTLETIPLFVKAGSIIPMMPVMQYIDEQKNHPIILKVFPRNTGKASFHLYEDDGTTNNYKKEIFSKTEIVCDFGKDRTILTIDTREMNGYQNEARNFLIEIPFPAKPGRVMVNSEKVKASKLQHVVTLLEKDFNSRVWSYDSRKQMISVRVPNTLKKIVIEIER